MQAPPDFSIDGTPAVFVRFAHAAHELELDARSGRVAARSSVRFETSRCGLPLFDLASLQVDEVRIDGRATRLREVSSPDVVTCYRTLEGPVEPGRHLLEIGQEPEGIAITDGRARCCLQFRDRGQGRGDPRPTDRFFLERYLPANLEFDRHPVRLEIRLRGAAPHRLLTNALSTRRTDDGWVAEFPDWFAASSPFVFLLPEDDLVVREQVFTRRDGSEVAVCIAGRKKLRERVEAHAAALGPILGELEREIGRFPFGRYLVFAVEDGGMEYAGACTASGSTLRHETIHNYFGRCVSPVDGDAAWVDEAIATWLEVGRTPGSGEFEGRNLGNRSAYARATPGWAGDAGARVLDLLDERMRAEKGADAGVRAFLRHWYASRAFQQFTARDFQRDLEAFAKTSFEDLFAQKVYGRGH